MIHAHSTRSTIVVDCVLVIVTLLKSYKHIVFWRKKKDTIISIVAVIRRTFFVLHDPTIAMESQSYIGHVIRKRRKRRKVIQYFAICEVISTIICFVGVFFIKQSTSPRACSRWSCSCDSCNQVDVSCCVRNELYSECLTSYH